MSAAWSTGRIVKFDQERGYGFIAPDAGDDDLFVHTNDLCFEKALARPGVEVKFRLDQAERGPKAADVALASEPRRAQKPGKLTRDDLIAEITDLLLDAVPELTGRQILTIRGRVVDFVVDHGMI